MTASGQSNFSTNFGPSSNKQSSFGQAPSMFNPSNFFGQQKIKGVPRSSTVMMAADGDFEVKDSKDDKDFREKESMNLSKKLAIDDIPDKIKGSRVLMRVDFNVPMKDGEITDPKRIVSTIPSIKYLLDNGAKSVVLMSHLGRPDGNKNDKFSLKPVVGKVSELVGKDVTFVPDCVGEEATKATAEAKDGQVILLENLRFYPAEEGKGVVNGEKVKATAEEVADFRE